MTQDDKYNGWTNYATWRIQLELISDYVNGMFDADAEWLEEQSEMSIGDMRDMLKEYAEEAVDTDNNEHSLAVDYALAFLNEVNWNELAIHALDDLKEEVKYRKQGLKEATT